MSQSRRGLRSRKPLLRSISRTLEFLESRTLLSSAVGAISGTVFNDANADWNLNAGEARLANWTVYVDSNNNGKLDAGESSTTTDAQGNWQIGNLAPGNYTVREVLQSGWRPTIPGTAANVQVTAGTTRAGVLFGNTHKTYIAGTVFNDSNGDGSQDNGEPGLGGVTVYVDANNDGKLDAGDSSTVTDAQGRYAMWGADPGTYPLREIAPSGFTVTAPPAGGAYNLTLGNAGVAEGMNFANRASSVTPPPPSGSASISGNVFNDANADWVRESNEAGLAGWTVYVDSNNNGQLDAGEKSATTDSQGNWTIGGLAGGTYNVREVLQNGWRAIPSTLATVQVAPGASRGGVAFGNTQRTYIAGTVFKDSNGDGVQDNGEAGLGGVTVYVDVNNDGKLDAGDASTTTDGLGHFAMWSVNGGSYALREIAPSGLAVAKPAGGAFNLNLANAGIAEGLNFANQSGTVQPPPPGGNASISGNLFNDADANWAHDANEPGLSGWTVYIDSNNNGQLDAGEASATTNAQGNWTIGGLAGGTYTVREVLQSGWRPTVPGPFATVQVAAGATHAGVVFGNTQKTYIAGTVFKDSNNDGKQDNGEPGVAGVTVYVDANNDGQLDAGDSSTTTDANGNFAMWSADAGSYPLREIAPSGFTAVTTSGGSVYNLTLGPAGVTTGLTFANQATQQPPPPANGFVISAVRQVWSYDSTKDIVTFYAFDPGTGVLAGSSKVQAEDATLSSAGGLEIRAANGTADFTGTNSSLAPTASFISLPGGFVAAQNPDPNPTPTFMYKDFQSVPQFEVATVSLNGIPATTGPGTRLAVAVVPHGSAVTLAGKIGADLGPALDFSYTA